MEKAMSKQNGFLGVPQPSLIPSLCAKCHSNEELIKKFDPQLPTDQLEKYRTSVHGRKDNGGNANVAQCVTCHGVHDIAPVSDPKSRVFPTNVVKVCAGCHGNADYMKAYNPGLAVDQFEKFKTSVHGQRLISGDSKAAGCPSCHGNHDIRPGNDPKSSVYVMNVPKTCAKCHSDIKRMQGYHIPTDQYDKFVRSVHGKALLERHDTGAPSCNKCHGNHGAVPPGVQSISSVCGTCHALNAQLFTSSPHKKAFDRKKIPECGVCHSSHDVQTATVEMLGIDSTATCSQCHRPNDTSKGYFVAARMRSIIDSLKKLDDRAIRLVSDAEQMGMEVSDARFSLNDVRQALLESRTKVHSFDLDQLTGTTGKGFEIAAQCIATAQSAVDDYYYRRIGLGISTLVISLLAVGLFLKIRKVERKQK
jgi:hypothetical protein